MAHTIEELKEMKAKAEAARAAKAVKALADYEAKRLRHEAITIPEAEVNTGTTLGVDLGVVWLKSGDCVLVRKPVSIKFEKYQLKSISGKVDMSDIDALLAPPTLVYPPTLGELEKLQDEAPEVKFAAALVANRFAEVDQKSLEGKSS